MTIKKLNRTMELLEVNGLQLAALLGKHQNSIKNYRTGKTKISHTEELALEALIHRKLEGKLWKDLSK